jgi:hypothetical protein
MLDWIIPYWMSDVADIILNIDWSTYGSEILDCADILSAETSDVKGSDTCHAHTAHTSPSKTYYEVSTK